MSFETKSVVARLDAVEDELMELRSSCQSIAVALINITRLVDMAVAKLDDGEEQRRVDENLRDGKCPDGCCDVGASE